MFKSSKSGRKMTGAMHAAIILPIVALIAMGWAVYNPEFGVAAKVNPFKALPKRNPGSTLKSKVIQVDPVNSPVVTKIPLQSSILLNVDQDLFKFNVSPLHPGAIAMKQIAFSYSKSDGIALSNLRLRRGSTDISDAYDVRDIKGADLKYGMINATSSQGLIIINFQGEAFISSTTTNDFMLHASVSGASLGKNLSISLYNGPTSKTGNGYLTQAPIAPFIYSGSYIYHLDTTSPPVENATVADLPGYFLWTDLSAAKHSSTHWGSWRTSDWFNGSQGVGTQTFSL